MTDGQPGRISGPLGRLLTELNPFKSFTFLLALGLTALAAWRWFNESSQPPAPFPFYGIIAVSYAGGFLIGRVFWRFVKMAAFLAAILLGALAVLQRMNVDTSKAGEEAEAGSAWVRNEASRAKHYLVHFLPSGFTAGVGVFAGSRRRGWGHGKNLASPTNPQT